MKRKKDKKKKNKGKAGVAGKVGRVVVLGGKMNIFVLSKYIIF